MNTQGLGGIGKIAIVLPERSYDETPLELLPSLLDRKALKHQLIDQLAHEAVETRIRHHLALKDDNLPQSSALAGRRFGEAHACCRGSYRETS